MKSIGTIKRHDTLSFYVNLKNGNNPITGIANNLKSQCRDRKGVLKFEFSIHENENSTGQYIFNAPANVDLKAGTIYLVDIQITDNGIVQSTETFSFNVVEEVTQ